MKVVHIYKDYYPPVLGGIETHINALATGMRDTCEPSVLVCNTKFQTEHEVRDGVRVTKVACLGRALSEPIAPTFPYWLKKQRADILHFHLPLPTSTLAYLLTRPKGHVVATYHSDIVRQAWALRVYGPIQQAFLRKAERILVTSPNYLNSSIHLQPHRDRCRVVPLGMDLSLFEPSSEILERAKTLRNKLGAPMVLFVGKLRAYKGVTYLLAAMKHVDAHLVLVGGGPLESELREQARSLGIENRTHFLGDKERALLTPYYYASDVFCLPSIYRSEAFGLVQIEAAACEIPVVSTALDSGVPFVNQHEKTGLIVPIMDSSSLADALNRLLGDESLRRKLGQYARQRALREFTLEKLIGRVREIYKEVLNAN